MKNLKSCIVSSLILTSSCSQLQIPQGPECIILKQGLFCIDTSKKLEDKHREYNLPIEDSVGFQCTTNKHRAEMRKFTLELMKQNDIFRLLGR